MQYTEGMSYQLHALLIQGLLEELGNEIEIVPVDTYLLKGYTPQPSSNVQAPIHRKQIAVDLLSMVQSNLYQRNSQKLELSIQVQVTIREPAREVPGNVYDLLRVQGHVATYLSITDMITPPWQLDNLPEITYPDGYKEVVDPTKLEVLWPISDINLVFPAQPTGYRVVQVTGVVQQLLDYRTFTSRSGVPNPFEDGLQLTHELQNIYATGLEEDPIKLASRE